MKSSNDRYGNLAVNYLLQRLEAYTGVAILTTNKEAALDEALQRRLSLHLHLKLPEAEERQRLWMSFMPTKAPVAEMRDSVEKSVEKSVEALNKLRDAATRSVNELTDSARRMFSREERKAEEFKKAVQVLFDHLEERVDTRITDIQATLAHLDGHGPAAPGEDPATGPAEPAVRNETTQTFKVGDHVEMLRERLKVLEEKVAALKKLDPK